MGGAENWLHEHIAWDVVRARGVPAVLRAIEAGAEQVAASQAGLVRVVLMICLKDSDHIVLDPPVSLLATLEESMAQYEPPAVHVSRQSLYEQAPARPKYESPVNWPPTDTADCANWIPVYATSLYDSSVQSPWGRSIALIRRCPSVSL